MNTDQIAGRWKEFKGEFLSKWGEITENELDKTKGDAMAIQGLIQQRYGKKEAEFKDRVDQLINKYAIKKDEMVEMAKRKLKH